MPGAFIFKVKKSEEHVLEQKIEEVKKELELLGFKKILDTGDVIQYEKDQSVVEIRIFLTAPYSINDKKIDEKEAYIHAQALLAGVKLTNDLLNAEKILIKHDFKPIAIKK